MFCRSLLTSSPSPQPTTSVLIGPLPLTGSQDSERTVSEAAVGEAATQVDQPAVESAHLEEAMIMVEHPATDVARASITLDTTLA